MNEVEQLTAEVKRLREALEEIEACAIGCYKTEPDEGYEFIWMTARAALSQIEGERS